MFSQAEAKLTPFWEGLKLLRLVKRLGSLHNLLKTSWQVAFMGEYQLSVAGFTGAGPEEEEYDGAADEDEDWLSALPAHKLNFPTTKSKRWPLLASEE